MTFWHVVSVVKGRIRIVLGLMAATLFVIVVAAPKPKVTYEAVCYMSPTPQAMQGGISTASESPQNVQPRPERNVILSNLILLAESGEVYQKALDFLALPVERQREVHPGLPAYKQIPRLTYAPGKPLAANEWQDVLLVTPMVNASIGESGTTSDIIRLRVKMPNGDDVIYVANAVGAAFGEVYSSKSHEEMGKYIEFLGSGTDEARNKLAETETGIAEYRRQHRITGADAETQNAITALAQLESQRNAARADAEAARSSLADVDRQLAGQPLVRTDSLPADMNPNVVRLKEELAQAEAELRQMAAKYTPTHSTYKAQQAHIKYLRDQIAREGATFTKPVVNELHVQLVTQRSQVSSTYASATARLAALNAQVATAQSKIVGLAGTQKEIVELTREQQRASDEYALFVRRLAQARIADKEFEKYGSILPFDWARTPAGPIVDGPRKRLLLLYGLVLSLAFGIALCVWLDAIDNRVRDVRDVEELLGLPSVGVIPALQGQDGQLPQLTHLFPLSSAAESYRILRTNILFAQRDNPFKTLMVATGKPGQGATTTICNLAIALAQAGKKIILIDADLRRPALHRFFGLPNDTGLSTLLRDNGNPSSCFRDTEIPNLVVIPAGPPPLNPSELLGSNRMWEIVEQLKDNCDLVLFDTPSTLVFSDGPVLASWLDAVLFVMSADQVPRGTEHDALNILRKAKANIIGVVVNRMSPDSVESCYFYAHYYPTESMDTEVYKLAGGDGKPKKELEGHTQSGEEAGPAKDEKAGSTALASADSEGESDSKAKNAESEGDNPFPQ